MNSNKQELNLLLRDYYNSQDDRHREIAQLLQGKKVYLTFKIYNKFIPLYLRQLSVAFRVGLASSAAFPYVIDKYGPVFWTYGGPNFYGMLRRQDRIKVTYQSVDGKIKKSFYLEKELETLNYNLEPPIKTTEVQFQVEFVKKHDPTEQEDYNHLVTTQAHLIKQEMKDKLLTLSSMILSQYGMFFDKENVEHSSRYNKIKNNFCDFISSFGLELFRNQPDTWIESIDNYNFDLGLRDLLDYKILNSLFFDGKKIYPLIIGGSFYLQDMLKCLDSERKKEELYFEYTKKMILELLAESEKIEATL